MGGCGRHSLISASCGVATPAGRRRPTYHPRINPHEGCQHIKRVKIQDSKKNNLIQLADMVCGAVYRSVDRGEDEFRKLIKPRELQVRIWP